MTGRAALVLVYTLYASREDAKAAARDAVGAGLAACANILSPVESVYIWEGALEQQGEYPVLFKTDSARAEALKARIGRNHPYAVPAILSWGADAVPGFARWVEGAAGL